MLLQENAYQTHLHLEVGIIVPIMYVRYRSPLRWCPWNGQPTGPRGEVPEDLFSRRRRLKPASRMPRHTNILCFLSRLYCWLLRMSWKPIYWVVMHEIMFIIHTYIVDWFTYTFLGFSACSACSSNQLLAITVTGLLGSLSQLGPGGGSCTETWDSRRLKRKKGRLLQWGLEGQ